MSCDLQLWTISTPVWREILPDYGEWTLNGRSLIYAKKNWQIIIGPESKVLDEDIPDEIMAKLAGIQYLAEITLKPIHVPKSIQKLLGRVASRAAAASFALFLPVCAQQLS